ncbi:hypothetical protein R3P38DRAFT_3229026 [Favolaschia claudopus]|uniref:Uncharacterized protein n=1 Tax=Favolaschia claudopus TaxID=2862362 RepID=A0AAV9ZPL9_9AGAR
MDLGSTSHDGNPRTTDRQNTKRERERKLRERQAPSGQTVSIGTFMAKKRKAEASTSNTLPNMPGSFPVQEDVEMDVDVYMPDAQLNQPPFPASSASAETSPPQSGGGAASCPDIPTNTSIVDPSISTTAESEAIARPRESEAEESPFWFWQIILFLTAWLHLHYHLPHRACALLLKILRNIFITLRHIPSDNNVPITLATAFKN